jgi:PadR family transcriptional regulator, regulatory protein PadR
LADSSLLQGTLDGLILKALTWGPRHGYAVARWIKDTSGDSLEVEDRALYVALHRLEERGWVESSWGLSEANRKAKYYRLTAAGRAQRNRERERLIGYANAIIRVFDAAEWGEAVT